MPRALPSNSLLRLPGPAPTAAATPTPAPPERRRSAFALPPHLQFVSVYNPATSVYRSWFDEALRNSQADALAMWRNGLIQDQLGRRWYAGRRLRWHIEADDRRDPRQKAAAEKYSRILQAIPRFGDLRMALQERMWYGKAGVNYKWGPAWVDGRKAWSIVDHVPVNGDSIGRHFDGSPLILINTAAATDPDDPPPHTERTDRGRALMLDTPFWRDQFAIARFQPHAPDWGHEPEMALSLYGYGLRGRLYWTMWLHNEVQGWHLDALKRFGSNGMLYGFYEEGDDQAAEVMLAALKQIVMENVTAFPRPKGAAEPTDVFHHIEAANIAYEVQSQFVDKMEGIAKRVICGTEETLAGSLGASGYAEKAFGNLIAVDADEEGEILTSEVLAPIIRANDRELPFRLRVLVHPEPDGIGETTAALRSFYDMRIPFDVEEAYARTGFSPPKDGANVILAPDPNAAQAPGALAGPAGEHQADTGRPPSSNLPVGLNANIPRAMRSGGDEAAADAAPAGEAAPSPGPTPSRPAPDPDALRARLKAAMIEARKRKAAG